MARYKFYIVLYCIAPYAGEFTDWNLHGLTQNAAKTVQRSGSAKPARERTVLLRTL